MEKKRSELWIYVTIVVVLVVLAAVGVGVRRENRSKEAHAKAKLLIAALKAEGIKPPSEDQAVALFGTDGGVLTENAESPTARALLTIQLSNTGPGRRAALTDRKFLEAEETVLAVYAPDKLPAFKKWADSLTTGGP